MDKHREKLVAVSVYVVAKHFVVVAVAVLVVCDAVLRRRRRTFTTHSHTAYSTVLNRTESKNQLARANRIDPNYFRRIRQHHAVCIHTQC